MCVALGAIAAATAPAATLMVIRQYKARGPVSEMLLPVVAMDDALGLIAFAISMNIAQTLQSGAAMTVQGMLVSPLLEIVGSVVLGAALGLLLSLLARFFRSQRKQAGADHRFCVSGAGVVRSVGPEQPFVHYDDRRGDDQPLPRRQRHHRADGPLHASAVPFVLCHFRRRAGFVRPAHGGTGGRRYVVVRVLGKWLGSFLGSRLVKAHPNVQKYLGFTLIPQAGVAIGMAQLALTRLPAYGSRIQAVVLAGTLIYELVGPVVTKLALSRAGEIPAAAVKTGAATKG